MIENHRQIGRIIINFVQSILSCHPTCADNVGSELPIKAIQGFGCGDKMRRRVKPFKFSDNIARQLPVAVRDKPKIRDFFGCLAVRENVGGFFYFEFMMFHTVTMNDKR